MFTKKNELFYKTLICDFKLQFL